MENKLIWTGVEKNLKKRYNVDHLEGSCVYFFKEKKEIKHMFYLDFRKTKILKRTDCLFKF